MLHAKVLLADLVLQPVEPHVNALGQLWSDGTVSQTNSELVGTQQGRGGLGVAQVVENAALFEGKFGGGKETPVFGLLYRGTNDGNAVGTAGNRGIDESGRIVSTEIVVRSTDAAGFWPGQVGGVGEEA